MVVSNREPYEHRHVGDEIVCHRTDGGLTSALDAVLRRHGGTWVAWGSGEADRRTVGPDDVVRVPPESPAYRLRRVWLSEADVNLGYLGYANEVLWPLCHMTLDRVVYKRDWWDGYVALNRQFADAVIDELGQQESIVWVHDFHLALLPALIRKTVPSAPVSLFWHIPWPGPEVFRILPERKEMLEGMLAADSLVFQTETYARSFVHCVREFLQGAGTSSARQIHYRGHTTQLSARPISIDMAAFTTRARSKEVESEIAGATRQLNLTPGLRLGVGIDRLDYTKGLLKRLVALDTFFTRYPAYRGRFTFLQIGVPTRRELEAYRQYRDSVAEAVTDINRRHSLSGSGSLESESWQPILYHEGRISPARLTAYYRMADLALVSSVYDGMNLVAKEYVASQVDADGVLLVSHMTGAAEELTEAMIINPYDTDGVAEAIKDALEMPADKRRERMQAMRAYLAAHDIHRWVDGCMADAQPASAGFIPHSTQQGRPTASYPGFDR
jgi:trehalose 6-phosphate synthase